MKVRAIAAGSERSNAVGTVECECTAHGLRIVHLGVGAFSEDYAPAALTSGTSVLVPWSSIEVARVDGDQIFIAFDSRLSPHNRLVLTTFSEGRSADPKTVARMRQIVRIATATATLVAGILGFELSARFTGAGAPSVAIGVGSAGALAVLSLGFLSDRLIATGGTSPEAIQQAFAGELALYLPSLGRAPNAPEKKRAPLTLADLQGLLPRTTFAVVLTLTATALAAILVTRSTLSEGEAARADAPVLAPPVEAVQPIVAAAVPAARSALVPAAVVKTRESALASGAATLGTPCQCTRSDSLLWADPIPRLGVLVLSQRKRPGRGKAHKESIRKLYTELNVAVVNNGNKEIEQISLLVLFYEREREGSERRTEVSSRPLFFEGPLLPGQAIKWNTEGEGTEFEIQAPALGSLAAEGEDAAPPNAFAELLAANNRPVRLHGAMMLAFQGDPRAREGLLALREALREDEAPYLDRLLATIGDVRVCRLAVKDEGAKQRASGCLYNSSNEPKRELGIKLRGLDGPVLASDPVGTPPNLLFEATTEIPGELAARTGAAFSAPVDTKGLRIATWEAVADRVDLLR
jgi:hypothetical protein